MPDLPIASMLVAALLALVLVGLVRRVALRHQLLDHPNERSSHVVATPRGGGIGLVGGFILVALAILTRDGDGALFVATAAMVAVALVGWLDDRHGLNVAPRLAVHALAAGVLGLIAADRQVSIQVAIGVFCWWTFWTISSINVVNFMDGINGLVASQVMVFALSLSLLLHRQQVAPTLALALAGACVGFLPWNFPRARIFLGDVGSGALGYAVAWLGLDAGRTGGIDVVSAYLPLFPLFADAATTMLIRWHEGEQLTVAHRRHLYQRLANGGMGHTRVTLIYAALALVGSLVAGRESDVVRTTLIVGYGVTVIVLGLVLHRVVGHRETKLT